MENQLVSLSMHDAIVNLDIPILLIESLKIMGLQLYVNTGDRACIHIQSINNCDFQFLVEDNNKIIEDTIVKSDQVLFRLFVEIEDLMMRQNLHKNGFGLALHGGGVVLNGKAIIVLQEKGAGKSTLIAKLTKDKAHRYLSDDLLISDGKNVMGFPLPIRLRQLRVQGLELMKGRIQSGTDYENKTRYFYMPEIEAETSAIPVSKILIPHYAPYNSNCIEQVKGIDKARILINQIKKYSNMEQMYNNVLLLSNSVDVYDLYYKDFSVLDSQLLWD